MALALAATLAACGGEAARQAPPAGGDAASAAPPRIVIPGDQTPAPAAPGEAAPVPTGATAEVSLYFADARGRLAAEKRVLPWEGTPAEQARRVVQALLEGPREGLTRVVPPDTSLRALYLGEDGTAYVDLDAAFARGLSGGSEDALIAVRSIASTLALSLPEVQRVKILIEGEEVNDLGGHLDLSQPLIPEAQPR